MLPDCFILRVYVPGLGETNIEIVHEDDYYWCEGKEYDYGAQGDSQTEAIRNFTIGLARTIEVNKQRGRTIDWLRLTNDFTVLVPGPIVQRIERHSPKVGI